MIRSDFAVHTQRCEMEVGDRGNGIVRGGKAVVPDIDCPTQGGGIYRFCAAVLMGIPWRQASTRTQDTTPTRKRWVPQPII